MIWMTPELANALGAALTAAALYLAKLLADKLKLSSDSEVRGYLMDVVNIAAEAAARKLRALPSGQDAVDLREDLIAEAASYVIAKAPDALKHFGISDDALRDMVDIRLHPVLSAATATG